MGFICSNCSPKREIIIANEAVNQFEKIKSKYILQQILYNVKKKKLLELIKYNKKIKMD